MVGKGWPFMLLYENVFAAITKDAKFHILQKQTHAFSPLPYNPRIIESILCY
jgi:hypothetical protein